MDPVAEGGGPGGGEVTLLEADGGVYAFAGGRQAFVELVDPFAKAEAGAEEGDAAIRAPMNGRLVALAVEEGETVEAGQAPRRGRSDEDGARARRPARGRRARP